MIGRPARSSVGISVSVSERPRTDDHFAAVSGLRLGETGGDLSAVPRGLLILAVSLLAFRTRFLPRWLATFGYFVAAASLICVIGPAWWVPPFGVAALIGLFGFGLWALLVSLVILARAARRPSAS